MKVLHKAINRAPSPNHSSRNGRKPVATIFHYTGDLRDESALSWLKNPNSQVSAHFLIYRGGQIFQLVDVERAAWHAGVAEVWTPEGMESAANSSTIGIELCNAGKLDTGSDGNFWKAFPQRRVAYRGRDPRWGILRYDSGRQVVGWWEPFTGEQVIAARWLLSVLASSGYEEAAHNVQGHEEIAMPLGRKIDPGPLFPWEQIAPRRPAPRRTLPEHPTGEPGERKPPRTPFVKQ